MQWINCSDRLPTEADGDIDGDILYRDITEAGIELFLYSYQSASNFHQWLEGACKPAGEEGGDE